MKLIDILNMISKGELKEGTKIKYNDTIYKCKEGNVFDPKSGIGLLEYIYEENLNDEVEIIEPDHFADGGEMAEKIKELDISEMEIENFHDVEFIFTDIACKLNEVINKVNAQTTVLLTQNDKDYDEAVKALMNN